MNDETDYDEDDDEDEESYKPGGYHPVRIGDVFNDRFKVTEKLGWGHFSTVWKCFDMQTSHYVALKVQKSAKQYHEAAKDEVALLQCVVQTAQKCDVKELKVVELIDSFDHVGPHGTRESQGIVQMLCLRVIFVDVCMIFEMLGDNLLSLVRFYNYRGIPMPLVRRLTRDILEGLDFLHRQCNIIHTDLKPENLLLSQRVPEIPPLKRSLFNLVKKNKKCDTITKAEKKRLKNKCKKLRKKRNQQKEASDASETQIPRLDQASTREVACALQELSLDSLGTGLLSNFIPTDRIDRNVDNSQGEDLLFTSYAPLQYTRPERWISVPPEFLGRTMLLLPTMQKWLDTAKRKTFEFDTTFETENGKETTCYVLRYCFLLLLSVYS